MKISSLMNIIRNSKGTTSIIFICSTVVIIILSALFTDIGYIAFERYKLKANIDTIAKIGAEALSVSKEEAISVIENNVVKKIKGVNKLDIKISDNNREISIYTGRKLSYVFLKFIGFKDKQIESNVTAKISNVTSYKGIRPFAIEKREIIYGKQYYLSFIDESQNNEKIDDNIIRIVPLDLGKDSFEASILYGYRGDINTAELVHSVEEASLETDPNIIEKVLARCRHDVACTYERYENDCPKIFVIPVVDEIDYSGKKVMSILGFTAFFVEGTGEEIINSSGSLLLKGRFIKYTVNSNTSDGISDFGLLGVKLVHY